VLGGEEEVMMLVEEGAVESDQGMPLIVVEVVAGLVANSAGVCCPVHLGAFALDHHPAGAEAFDFCNQLLLNPL
jgi:hypothetical protein